MFDFIQRWFLDSDYNPEFGVLTSELNKKILSNDFNIDFEKVIKDNFDKIFSDDQKNLLDKRILMCGYLKYLSANNQDAQLLYSLYFDDNKKQKLAKNMIKKSIYEYYVTLKFKHKEDKKMTNIFALKNKPKVSELTPKQIDSVIELIEKLWVG